MIIIQEPQISNTSVCQYFPDRNWQFEYFFAIDVSDEELDELLERGWRKFGAYYFRPNCDYCEECIPIRVSVPGFVPGKSQRRVLKKCEEVEIRFESLAYRDEIYEVYKNHSLCRFKMATKKEDFIASFYTQSCSSLQSEYYIKGELAAVGFLDRSARGLSSVYFAYRTEKEKFSLGTFSVLREIEYARELGLEYYYLGYYIGNNSSMSYKNRFKPNEHYSWDLENWVLSDKKG